MRFRKLAAVGMLTFIGIAGPAVTSAVSARPVAAVQMKAVDHAAEECIKALEAGQPVENCQKAPNPILPATDEIVWGSIAFVALFLLLWKLALPAINKAMAARSAKIEGDLGAADKAKSDAEALLAEYRAKLADAKAQSDRIIDEARQQADAVRRDLIARAEADADAARAKATEDITAQAERIKADLQSHVKSLSLELAEKVVGANLDRETNSAIVDRYIAELGAK